MLQHSMQARGTYLKKMCRSSAGEVYILAGAAPGSQLVMCALQLGLQSAGEVYLLGLLQVVNW